MQNPILMLFLDFDVQEYPNPSWPPDPILKNQLFITVYHKTMNKLTLQRFYSMQNPILISFLHFDAHEYPNPRWLPAAILKNYLFI